MTREPAHPESDTHRPSIETLAVHSGRSPDPVTGAINPPIHLATTFERDPDGGYERGYQYTRDDNPNRAAVEQAMASLEGGERAAAFASGSAATLAVFQSAIHRGSVVASESAYRGTLRQLRELVPRFGGEVRFADTTDTDAVAAAMDRGTALVFVETPSNPMLGISDLAGLAEIAETHGAALACDSTFATPVLQNPLDLGATLVVHSSTKYLGGHSDLLGGMVVGRDDEWMEDVAMLRGAGGAAPSPFDCWLLHRSLPTLPWRIRAQCASALTLARFLAARDEVERVCYPGLPDHPGHELACRQMRGFGGMLSILLTGGEAAAMAVASRVKLFTRATSLGGVESLIEHRASIEGPETRTPRNLLRLSVGLEGTAELMEDLAGALGRISTSD